jgi:LmbE family N-acetylglucosaminyl deacetylase
MKRIVTAFLVCFAAVTGLAQAPVQYGSSEILENIKRLNILGSVLYIAAHPDDENTRLLTYLSREMKVRTGYLSLTRGDGGQNLVGKEQGEALRTQELLAARRIDGAEQFFTRANDFGYSKNPEETFRIWNRDSILADVVWVIRKFRPDIIICRFPSTGEGGHGHHTASAILAADAFLAAADPSRFPAQLAYVPVWKPSRLFWNTFNFGGNNTTSPDQLRTDVGGFNPLLGKSYGEIAAESRSMHRSQGFGTAKARGSQIEYFKQLKGDSVSRDLFERMDLSWSRVPEAGKLERMITACIRKYDAQAPQKSLPALASIYRQLEQLGGNDPVTRYWKKQKLKETEALMLACSGFWAEAYAAGHIGIPGKQIDITLQLIGRNSPVKISRIIWPGKSDTLPGIVLKENELQTIRHKETLHGGMSFSSPYWLNEPHSIGLFRVREREMVGQPQNDPPCSLLLSVEISGISLQVERAVVYKYTDPVKGEIYRPFEILPPATVNLSGKTYVFSGGAGRKLKLVVKANEKDVSGTLHIHVPEGWEVSPKEMKFSLGARDEEAVMETMLIPPSSGGDGKLTATLGIGSKSYDRSITRIAHDHIPDQFILEKAEVSLVTIDVKKAGTSIGYIPGPGDDIPASLEQIGYMVTALTDEALSGGDLSKYNAIVTGVRAYNTNERLQLHHNRLMEYVKQGGNLIVQYNTNNRIGPLLAKIGPYPFTISRDRVTDEASEVRIIKPDHPALTFPNLITSADFKGWVQERGIYFATETDSNYETVLSMNDPGEKPHEGSLIVAKHGKGNFVYTGLVFFRQLPAGIPGAYRLFANLLSLPQNK